MNCAIQIYRDLYGDALLGHIQMGSNMADGNQHKHVSLSLYKSLNFSLEDIFLSWRVPTRQDGAEKSGQKLVLVWESDGK